MFSKIGKAFDSLQTQQEKMQQMQQQQQQQNQVSIFSTGLGGAGIIQQAQQQEMRENQALNPFAMFSNLMQQKADAQQQKDFRRLESYTVKMCMNQCLRKERNYAMDSEFCMTKCYDSAFVYIRVGLNELNQFAYENNIN